MPWICMFRRTTLSVVAAVMTMPLVPDTRTDPRVALQLR